MVATLYFDKGTLLFKGAGDAAMVPREVSNLFVWDERVRCLRTCASNYQLIIEGCNSSGIQINDAVFKKHCGLPRVESVSLRPYQEVAVINWNLANKKGVVCLPTGAGKTRVAIAVMAATRTSTLCLVPTRVLLEQWEKSLREFYHGPIGIIGDNQNSVHEFTLATFESAYRKMSWLGNRFQLLIVDECHHFSTDFRSELFLMSAAPMRLGLTATRPKDPEQMAPLEKHIGPVVHEISLNDLVGTYLAPFTLIPVQIRLTPVEKIRYEREYGVFTAYFRAYKNRHPHSKWQEFVFFAQKSQPGRKALAAFFRTRRLISLTDGKRCATGKILQRHGGEKILVFTNDTESAYKLSREFLIMPITADIKRKEREQALTRFRNGLLMTLVSCKVLNEGVDVPDAAVAIIVGGTAVEREYVQRIGRVLRPAPGKQALIYELIAKDTHEERHASQRRHGLHAKNIGGKSGSPRLLQNENRQHYGQNA